MWKDCISASTHRLHVQTLLRSTKPCPDSSPSGSKELFLSGLVPFSTVDFPDTLAAVFFCQGCPWQCRYCHNPHLRSFSPESSAGWTWEEAHNFLKERSGFLEGIVFSGGEPTAQASLSDAIIETRNMGYRIGLHTSGAYPERLPAILPLVDWVGLDIKAPLDSRYDLITGVQGTARRVLSSLDMILESGIAYQLRTTVHHKLHSRHDLEDLNRQLAKLGTHPTVIQSFRKQGCLDTELVATAA